LDRSSATIGSRRLRRSFDASPHFQPEIWESRTGVVWRRATADVVVFDPARIQDHATFDQPHQYATGMHHVFVNGVPALLNGEHTGATPGRVVLRARGA
jgi:N-acyl-D-aspartate/D-glutamate deacylase